MLPRVRRGFTSRAWLHETLSVHEERGSVAGVEGRGLCYREYMPAALRALTHGRSLRLYADKKYKPI